MIVLSFSILMALIFTIIVHFFYAIDIVYTHIFYIPIILAAMWYPKKALSLAIFLGSLHITFAYISMGSIQIPSLLRAIILLLVAYVTSQVALKKERLTKEHQKIHEEMEKAWYIHRHTLPKNIPEIEGISISAYYQPAAKIGGDAYDIILYSERHPTAAPQMENQWQFMR